MATSPSFAQNVWPGRAVSAAGNAFMAGREAGGIARLGFGLLLFDTFLTASRFFEVAEAALGVPFPYVVTAIHLLTFCFALLSGGVRRLALTPTGISLILFTGWMFVCAPFSTWRTGTAQMIVHNWLPSFIGFFSCALLSSVRQCRRLGSVIAASGLTISFLSLFVARFYSQRLAFQSGTLANANDLSLLLLMAAPFFLIPILDPAANAVMKALGACGGMLVLIINFSTGSRAGLMALLAILLTLFLTRSLIGKLKLAGVSIALAGLLAMFIPSYSLYRYTTIFNDASSAQEIRNDETYGSAELRKELFQESLSATVHHPLFGVGPGVYTSAMAKEASAEGRTAQWRVSHNTYTQVSSEMGIPGLIFYLAAIACAFLDLFRARKQSKNNPVGSVLALCLLLSLVGLTINFFFASEAYMGWLPILLGMSAALRLNLQRLPQPKRNGLSPGFATAGMPLPRTPFAPAYGAAAQPVAASMPTPSMPHPQLDSAQTYRFLGKRQKAPR